MTSCFAHALLNAFARKLNRCVTLRISSRSVSSKSWNGCTFEESVVTTALVTRSTTPITSCCRLDLIFWNRNSKGIECYHSVECWYLDLQMKSYVLKESFEKKCLLVYVNASGKLSEVASTELSKSTTKNFQGIEKLLRVYILTLLNVLCVTVLGPDEVIIINRNLGKGNTSYV